MNLKSSIKKKYFEDRPGDVVRNPLKYDNSTGVESYIADEDLSNFLDSGGNVRTSATVRLGTVKSSNKSKTAKELENVGYPNAGINVGAVTVFVGSIPEQSAQDLVDFYRSGKNIKDIENFGRATTTVPMIRVSPDVFFENEMEGTIDHSLNLNAYGQGYLFTTVDEKLFNQKVIPFEDIGKLIPSDLIGKENTFAYPFVHTAEKNLEQFVDPSSTKINGAVDVFEERRSRVNSSVSDLKITGMKADIMAGGIETLRVGNVEIKSKKSIDELTSKLRTFYLDSQELEFPTQLFIRKSFDSSFSPGTAGDSKFSLPGLVTTTLSKMSYFEDGTATGWEREEEYKMLSTNQKAELLNSSDLSRSEIGTRFISSTNGLIFGEGNGLGTDSIAFGGLKK